MSMTRYSVVTAARNEEHTLPRLAAALAAQTLQPSEWIIVENGSDDATKAIAEELGAKHRWAYVISMQGTSATDRGTGVVRALQLGIGSLHRETDLVVNIDADVTFSDDFLERLALEFEGDPKLGIASGSAYECIGGRWAQRFVTGSSVWGATRAWRWNVLRDVLPFSERVGWDGVDEFKANARGWRTRTITTLPFYHHRPEGSRDATTWSARSAQGDLCYFVGYRPYYLVLRTLFQARNGLAAFGLIFGYAAAAMRHDSRCADQDVRRYVRQQQSLRKLLERVQEATGS